MNKSTDTCTLIKQCYSQFTEQNRPIDTYIWISKTWWVKQAKFKRIHMACFHLYEVLEQTRWCIVIEIWSVVPVEELGRETNCKEHEVSFWGNEMFFVIPGVRLHSYEYCSKSYNCTQNVCVILHVSFSIWWLNINFSLVMI